MGFKKNSDASDECLRSVKAAIERSRIQRRGPVFAAKLLMAAGQALREDLEIPDPRDGGYTWAGDVLKYFDDLTGREDLRLADQSGDAALHLRRLIDETPEWHERDKQFAYDLLLDMRRKAYNALITLEEAILHYEVR